MVTDMEGRSSVGLEAIRPAHGGGSLHEVLKKNHSHLLIVGLLRNGVIRRTCKAVTLRTAIAPIVTIDFF